MEFKSTKLVSYIATIFAIVFAVVGTAKLKNFLDEENSAKSDFERVRDFLLGDKGQPYDETDSTEKRFASRRNKTPLWIHIPFELNSRNWNSFSDRSNTNLNQPYIHLCIQSLIMHCNEDMNVCIIDDNSFDKLLPGIWEKIAIKIDHPNISTNFNLSLSPEPQRTNLRNLALLELVYRYSGIVVPASFLCFRNLHVLINKTIPNAAPFIVENVNKGGANSISAKTQVPNDLFKIGFAPDSRFFGSGIKKNPIIAEWIIACHGHLRDFGLTSQELEFSKTMTCVNAVKKHKIVLVAAENVCRAYFDPVAQETRPVLLDNLFEPIDKMHLSKNALGVWIPSDEILLRSKYNWFASISSQDIEKGDYALATMFRHSHDSIENQSSTCLSSKT